MIPKEAIEKAIEGGWLSKDPRIALLTKEQALSHWRDIALDPSFWQSLGKALGWDGKHIWRKPEKGSWYEKQYGKEARRCKACVTDNFIRRIAVREQEERCDANNPKVYAHLLYDLILTGGDTKKFWDELLV